MAEITLRGLSKRLGTTNVLTGVDLIVPDGTTTAVLGASGSGKTTLLRVIAGFEPADAGTICIDGKIVDDSVRTTPAQHRAVGYVPQEGALFPHLTVRGNVAFGIPRRDRARADELLELVGLDGLGKRFPHQLSGGQQQRVALARALAVRPSVVLLDEPFSSLDAALRGSLRRDVAHVLAETAATTILVTHDQQEALSLADQVAVLRDGHIVAHSDPRTLYHAPPDPDLATFIGEANLVPALIHDGAANCVLGTIRVHPNPTAQNGPHQLLIRPEQLLLHTSATNGHVRATIRDPQFHGHHTLLTVVLDNPAHTKLTARVPGNLAIHPDQRVWIEVREPVHAWPTPPSPGLRAKPTRGPAPGFDAAAVGCPINGVTGLI